MSNVPIAVTIAGSDSSGGAGIQADLKSFSANQAYGASVITALTAQNTLGVTAIHDISPEFITAQINAVFDDLAVDAVKIGMLSQAGVIEAVAAALKKHTARNIVLDPVMVTTSGDPLLADEAVDALIAELFPLADLVTPNLYEAARLTGLPVATSKQAMQEQAKKLLETGAAAVLVKGGHFEGQTASDLLVHHGAQRWYEAQRIDTRNTHGTGCSLSSAIAANLARNKPLEEAVGEGKSWLTGAIAASEKLEVGKGPGPVHHFYDLWRD